MSRTLRAPVFEDTERERRFNEAALRQMTDEDLREMERLLERLAPED